MPSLCEAEALGRLLPHGTGCAARMVPPPSASFAFACVQSHISGLSSGLKLLVLCHHVGCPTASRATRKAGKDGQELYANQPEVGSADEDRRRCGSTWPLRVASSGGLQDVWVSSVLAFCC